MKRNDIKIIVISDTHENVTNIEKLLPAINEADCLIHLGDGNADIRTLANRISCKVVTVKGNCDFSNITPVEMILEIGKTRFFITHGHTYGVKRSLIPLGTKAAQENCDYALYGHTHIPLVTKNQGTRKKNVTMINPGSLAANIAGKPTFAVLVGDGETFFAKIMEL